MSKQLKNKIVNKLRRYARAHRAPVKVPRNRVVKLEVVTIDKVTI